MFGHTKIPALKLPKPPSDKPAEVVTAPGPSPVSESPVATPAPPAPTTPPPTSAAPAEKTKDRTDEFYDIKSRIHKKLVETLDLAALGKRTDDDVKEAILQTCSDIDRPDSPGPAAVKAFSRKLVSLTDDIRLRYKEGLLGQTKGTVRDAAEKYFGSMSGKAGIAVIAGAEELEAANKKIPERPFAIHRI